MFNKLMLEYYQWSQLAGNVWMQRIPIAMLILAAGYFLRKPLTRFIMALIIRLIPHHKPEWSVRIKSFENPLLAFFIVLGAYLALVYLALMPYLIVLKLMRSAIAILITWGLYNLAGESLFSNDFQEKFNIDKILLTFFSKIIRFIIVILTICVVAREWGYDINGFIAGLGLGGLAFALAAKDTLANIFAGMVIIMDKPFSIGDFIKTPSVEGTVENISFRSTKVRTLAQALVTVPNSTLANEPVTNWSRIGKRKIDFTLGLSYNTSRDQLQKCLAEIKSMLENHHGINKDTILVKFDKFGESSLDIMVTIFTNTTAWEESLSVKQDINFKIMEILAREDVSLAFPTQSIYLENTRNIADENASV